MRQQVVVVSLEEVRNEGWRRQCLKKGKVLEAQLQAIFLTHHFGFDSTEYRQLRSSQLWGQRI